MASKNDMFNELLQVYTDNQTLFDNNNIHYLKWLDKIKTYSHTRMAYKFMFNKLYLCLGCLKKIWDCHSPATWAGLKIVNRGCDELKDLHSELNDFNIVWKSRPKFKDKI